MSKDSTPSPRAYALYRLMHPNAGANEAAEAVGYAGGRPTHYARSLYERVCQLQEMPEIAMETDAEILRLRKEIKRTKEKLKTLKEKKKAQDEWNQAAQVIRQAEDQKQSSA